MKNKILVTGGTGFLATELISQLLQKNYEVKTTIRSLKNSEKVIATLENAKIANLDKLTFAEADLENDKNWVEIMTDCSCVFSVASPVFFHVPKNEAEAIAPAVNGITTILKAAKASNVPRIIMTSNFGAVGFSNKNKNSETTEENWTNENDKGLSIYEKSKLIAERTAWDFANKNNMALTTINPVAIFGPSRGGHFSNSLSLINGTMKALPNIPLNIVDIRDVAEIHILAMETEESIGKRFIASADGQITMKEIVEIIKTKRPEVAPKICPTLLSSPLVKLIGLFNKAAHEGAYMLEINRNVSNKASKEILGWKSTRTNEQIVLDSIDSMVAHHVI